MAMVETEALRAREATARAQASAAAEVMREHQNEMAAMAQARREPRLPLAPSRARAGAERTTNVPAAL